MDIETLTILFWLGFAFLIISLMGYAFWAAVFWFIRRVTGKSAMKSEVQQLGLSRCSNCNYTLAIDAVFCGHCGFVKPTGIVAALLEDLTATARQVERFHRAGSIDDETYQRLKENIESERVRLTSRRPSC